MHYALCMKSASHETNWNKVHAECKRDFCRALPRFSQIPDPDMRQLFVNTNKEYIASLPRFSFTGNIVVVQSEKEAVRAIEILSREAVVGFDTETRPSFRKGHVNKVALLQISTLDVCFLFRLNMTGLLPCITQLLSNPDIMKVGLSLHDDLAALHMRTDFQPSNFLELQQMAKEMGIEDQSLQKLYANVFHLRISKSARLSNWEADTLTDAQKSYAATDAYTCLQLYYEMQQLRKDGAYQWAIPPVVENKSPGAA